MKWVKRDKSAAVFEGFKRNAHRPRVDSLRREIRARLAQMRKDDRELIGNSASELVTLVEKPRMILWRGISRAELAGSASRRGDSSLVPHSGSIAYLRLEHAEIEQNKRDIVQRNEKIARSSVIASNYSLPTYLQTSDFELDDLRFRMPASSISRLLLALSSFRKYLTSGGSLFPDWRKGATSWKQTVIPRETCGCTKVKVEKGRPRGGNFFSAFGVVKLRRLESKSRVIDCQQVHLSRVIWRREI